MWGKVRGKQWRMQDLVNGGVIRGSGGRKLFVFYLNEKLKTLIFEVFFNFSRIESSDS